MTIRELLKDNSHFMDYELCLSQCFTVADPNDAELDLTTVSDYPILCIASNDEDKELRFIIEAKDLDLIKSAQNRIIHLIDQKLDSKGMEKN